MDDETRKRLRNSIADHITWLVQDELITNDVPNMQQWGATCSDGNYERFCGPEVEDDCRTAFAAVRDAIERWRVSQ